jgi:hypothetical protein
MVFTKSARLTCSEVREVNWFQGTEKPFLEERTWRYDLVVGGAVVESYWVNRNRVLHMMQLGESEIWALD